ncbi:hypothetical protein CON11_22965 [Priestia megaterium]|nr:hypothetical protein CON11_22965 [Priestia megaterium]
MRYFILPFKEPLPKGYEKKKNNCRDLRFMRYRYQIRFYMNGDESGKLNGSKTNFEIIDNVFMGDAFFVGGGMYLK